MPPLCRHNCSVIARSTCGISTYPLASPPSWVVRAEEAEGRLRAVKPLLPPHALPGRKAGAGRFCSAQPAPRYQKSSREGSGHGGEFHLSPTLAAVRASMVISSGSHSDKASLPEGSNAAESSSPDDSNLPSDAAIDIRSSAGALKKNAGTPLRKPSDR